MHTKEVENLWQCAMGGSMHTRKGGNPTAVCKVHEIVVTFPSMLL